MSTEKELPEPADNGSTESPSEAETAGQTTGIGSGAGGAEVLQQITTGNPGSLTGTSNPA